MAKRKRKTVSKSVEKGIERLFSSSREEPSVSSEPAQEEKTKRGKQSSKTEVPEAIRVVDKSKPFRVSIKDVADFVDVQVLIFEIEREKYAIELKYIDQIFPIMKIKQIPKKPDFIEGLIEVRGEVIPVMDMRKFLGGRRDEYYRFTRIVSINIYDRKLGIIVDNVSEVAELTRGQLKDTVIVRDKNDFVDGMAKVGKDLIQLFELDKLLDMEKLNQLAKSEKK